MNISPTLTICCTLLVIGSGMVAAQISQNPEYEKPVDRQWDEGLCHAKMVDSLYQGTDVTNPNQDRYMVAAEAYRLLDQAGQGCE